MFLIVIYRSEILLCIYYKSKTAEAEIFHMQNKNGRVIIT